MNVWMFSSKIKTEHIGAFVLFISIAPFFILCFFAHPSFVDDYCFATKTMEMGLMNAFLDWYINWTGRYSLCFLMSLNPLLIKSIWLCKALLSLLILLLPFASFYLIKAIFPKQKTGLYISLMALFNFFYLYQLPSVSDGLYWMTGAMAYQMPNICLIVILTLLIHARKKKNYLTLRYFFICLLAIVMIGANEISMLTFLLFIASLILLDLVKKQTLQLGLLLIFLVSIICSLFVIFAPGNNVRGSLFPMSHDVIWSLLITMVGMGYYSMQWLAVASLLTILILNVLRSYDFEWDVKSNKISLPISLLFFGMILLVGFFVPAWATGQMPNPRAINILFLIFLLGFFYHLAWVQQLFFKKHQDLKLDNKISMIVVLALFFITFYPGKLMNNNIKLAYVDLISGKASRYDNFMFTFYETGNLTELEAKPFQLISQEESFFSSYQGCPELYFKKYYLHQE
jgi:Family of unknown function (DUF6056)